MHIILGILGLLGAAAYWLFILRRGADVARDGYDAATGAYGKARWWFWKKKNIRAPHQLIDDPRVSATALVLALFREDGVISDTQWTFMRNNLRVMLSESKDSFEDILAQARFSISEMRDSGRFATKQAQFLAGSLAHTECQQFQRLYEKAFETTDRQSTVQQTMLTAIQRQLGER